MTRRAGQRRSQAAFARHEPEIVAVDEDDVRAAHVREAQHAGVGAVFARGGRLGRRFLRRGVPQRRLTLLGTSIHGERKQEAGRNVSSSRHHYRALLGKNVRSKASYIAAAFRGVGKLCETSSVSVRSLTARRTSRPVPTADRPTTVRGGMLEEGAIACQSAPGSSDKALQIAGPGPRRRRRRRGSGRVRWAKRGQRSQFFGGFGCASAFSERPGGAMGSFGVFHFAPPGSPRRRKSMLRP